MLSSCEGHCQSAKKEIQLMPHQWNVTLFCISTRHGPDCGLPTMRAWQHSWYTIQGDSKRRRVPGTTVTKNATHLNFEMIPFVTVLA